jgi:hypothetical protein
MVRCKITGRVALVDGTPIYSSTFEVTLRPVMAAQVRAFSTILTVRADPDDPSRIKVSLKEQTPMVTVTDPALIEPPVQALRAGEPCTIRILGHWRQWLRHPDGDEIFACKVRIIDDGSELQVRLLVPVDRIDSFTVGSELPAKRLAGQPGVLAIDWDSAPGPARPGL